MQVLAHELLTDQHDLGHLMCRQVRVHLNFENHLAVNHSTVQPCTMAWWPLGAPMWLVKASHADVDDGGGLNVAGPQPYLTIVLGEGSSSGLYSRVARPEIPTMARLYALLACTMLVLTNWGGRQA